MRLDVNTTHILLGRPQLYDLDVTNFGRTFINPSLMEKE